MDNRPYPITFTNGQFGAYAPDVMLPKAQEIGFDGIEIACGSALFDVRKSMTESDYCDKVKENFAAHNLKIWALGGHCAGQSVLDPRIDKYHTGVLPKYLYEGVSDQEQIRANCIQEMKDIASAAKKLGAGVVTGFTGSPVWDYVYTWPPVEAKFFDDGFKTLYDRWTPILDFYGENGIKFALEVHPTEIAFDYYSAERTIEALKGHPAFGFNFDPSHLLWQGVDPADFIYGFKDRIYHVHMKDVKLRRNGRNGVLGSHIGFGDGRRYWNFCSLGRGDVNFEEVFRALKHIGYNGPVSVEWEDNDMDGFFGLQESFNFVKNLEFKFSVGSFEDQLGAAN